MKPNIVLTTFITLSLWLGALAGYGQQSESGDAALERESSVGAITNDVPVVEEPDVIVAPRPNTENRRSRGAARQPMVRFGSNAILKAGESAEAVVVIGGNAEIEGDVQEAVVAIGGNVTMRGKATARTAVAVLGAITVQDQAVVESEAVSVGGGVSVTDDGKIKGQIQDVDFSGILPRVEWLQKWVKECVFLLRPLSFQVGWVWGVAAVFFLLYLLVAVVFPRPVAACVDVVGRRPATTFVVGLLTKLLLPIIFVILAVTVIGAFVIPFVVAALFLGAIVGKVAVLEWLGLSLGRAFRVNRLETPVFALAAGSLLVCLIYLVPRLGLVSYMVFSLWGLGAAVTAAFGGFKREMPAGEPAGGLPYASSPVSAPGSLASTPLGAGETLHCSTSSSETAGVEGAASMGSDLRGASALPPLMTDAALLPKASFWDRMAAGFLDIVLVSILGHFVGGLPFSLVIALAYFAGMWCWRGTTIGGIVIGIKVVRQDGQPVTFAVALVRGLSAAFSIIVLFLGFLNITWDKEKQGWHDRIAGTLVVKQPKSAPLLLI